MNKKTFCRPAKIMDHVFYMTFYIKEAHLRIIFAPGPIYELCGESRVYAEPLNPFRGHWESFAASTSKESPVPAG